MNFYIQDINDLYTLIESDSNLISNIFDFQIANNPVLKKWNQISPSLYLDGTHTKLKFLPISLYKSHVISSYPTLTPQLNFRSSGTTQLTRSILPVYRKEFYEDNTVKIFQHFFNQSPSHYRIIALLPGYLERKDSSLVHMVDYWMSLNSTKSHGFYLHQYDELIEALQSEEPTILIGVSFALIDLADQLMTPLPANTIVIETGGMKGDREEWTKSMLHDFLMSRLQPQLLFSEYGMTELMSQSYMLAGQRFNPPSTMKILVRDENDPTRLSSQGKGAINIIDLANVDTCSFIATDDQGVVYEDGSFEILGRLSTSEIRGCSQLYFEQ